MMDDIYQSLEKMVRDVEKGATRVLSQVKVDSQVYDAECYRVRFVDEWGGSLIRINLEGKSVSVGSKI